MKPLKTDRIQIALAASSLTIFVASYNIATISVSLHYLETYLHIGGVQLTFLTSAILMGAVLGAFFSGILSDRFGRMGILTFDLITFVLAGILSSISTSYLELLIFRTMVGVGVGIDYVVVFAYMAEKSTSQGRRNSSLALIMFFANFGILMAYAIGAILLMDRTVGWRYVLLSGSLLAIPSIALRLRLSESESWIKYRLGSTYKILRSFLSKEHKSKLFKYSIPWFLYQIGDQSLTLYLPFILVAYSLSSFSNGALGSVFVKIFTIPASFLTFMVINRVGKGFLQVMGFILRAIFLALTGFVFYLSMSVSGYVIITLLGLAFFFGAMGPDKTTVIMPADNYPTEIRATGQGMNEALGRIGGIVGVLGFGLFSVIGIGYGLWFLSATCFAGFLFTAVFIGSRREGIMSADSKLTQTP